MIAAIIFLSAIIVAFIALFGAFIYMIKPEKTDEKTHEYFRRQKYAHRGLHGNGVPENSLKGFRLACEKGYGIETDVQLSSDGMCVIFHDDSLERMTGDKRWVRDVPFSELRKMKLAGTEETIPSFRDFLDTVDGRVPLVVELKTMVPFGDINELCRKVSKELDRYRGEYVIESFDPAVVEWYRKNRPNVIRGQLAMLPRHYVKDRQLPGGARLTDAVCRKLGCLLYNSKGRPNFIAYRYEEHNIFVDICRSFGAVLVAWTVRSSEGEKKALENYDCVIAEQYLD